MARLTMNRAGLESPLRIGGAAAEESGGENTRGRGPRGGEAASSRPDGTTGARPEPPTQVVERPFLGAGRPVQTALRLELGVVDRVGALATSANVSVNALVVAVLEASAPRDLAGMISLVRSQVEREREASTENNLRLPSELRVRLDELVRALPAAARISRSQVINAVLVDGLPARAEDAADLVRRFRQRSAAASLDA